MSLHWLPNAISIMRIVLVLPILWLIHAQQFAAALWLFLLAGFSDGLDGWLAKHYNWHTRLGAMLDPIADKLLIASVFILLVVGGYLPLWLGAVVVFRDVVIVGGATAYNFLVRPIEGQPTRISKLNTAVELVLVVFVLSSEAFGWPPMISVTVLGAAVLVTVVISGVDYVLRWSQRAREVTDKGSA